MRLPQSGGNAEPEIVYSLEPAYWGHGYATEASIAVLRYAFQTIGLPRVLGAADPPNTRSLKLLQRLHMQPLARGPVPGLPYMHITREHFIALHRA
jgi:RimJ/RimL family protein N-acetyltransferase